MKRVHYSVILFALLVSTACNDVTFRQSNDSMAPTINRGDVMYCDKLDAMVSGIKRGDIVIIKAPDQELIQVNGPNTRYVYRVVGLAGDRVELIDGLLLVNKEPAEGLQQERDPSLRNYGPVTVPPEEYFLVGDNLADTIDSRSWKAPTIKRNLILGRVTLIKDGKTGALREL